MVTGAESEGVPLWRIAAFAAVVALLSACDPPPIADPGVTAGGLGRPPTG
jgi:hypothetical protein